MQLIDARKVYKEDLLLTSSRGSVGRECEEEDQEDEEDALFILLTKPRFRVASPPHYNQEHTSYMYMCSYVHQ